MMILFDFTTGQVMVRDEWDRWVPAPDIIVVTGTPFPPSTP